MHTPIEFFLGLLDAGCPAHVAGEDFEGRYGASLRLWQQIGFLATEPGMNPASSCPHCFIGTPYWLGDSYVCNRCRCRVDVLEIQLWRFDLERFLQFLASRLSLRGSVERIDDHLWQLGTHLEAMRPTECFFLRGDPCSAFALRRLQTFRSVCLLHGKSVRPVIAGFDGSFVSLREILVLEHDALSILPLQRSRPRGGDIRFDPATGVLAAGETVLGRVPRAYASQWVVSAILSSLTTDSHIMDLGWITHRR